MPLPAGPSSPLRLLSSVILLPTVWGESARRILITLGQHVEIEQGGLLALSSAPQGERGVKANPIQTGDTLQTHFQTRGREGKMETMRKGR